jgi:hypothetical protein
VAFAEPADLRSGKEFLAHGAFVTLQMQYANNLQNIPFLQDSKRGVR